MSVLIEDSPRNIVDWICESVDAKIASGTIVTPWASPWLSHPNLKPRAVDRVQELQGRGVPVLFDPMTHALQMSGVGDFRFYDEYDLWGGPRGDLSDAVLREEHVARVFEVQQSLAVRHLAPTELLHTGLSNASARALELAREAVRLDPKCVVGVAGTMPFWASGGALDAHVGALASLTPAEWVVTVVHSDKAIPPHFSAEGAHGLCRTVRALSELGPVHVSHGDFGGLPAIAAGATSVGSGWDFRQRRCSYVDYAARPGGVGGGGGWNHRPTLAGLLGTLLLNEATVVESRDVALVSRLGGLPAAPAPRPTYDHHMTVLTAAVETLRSESDLRRRYELLTRMYSAANANWAAVRRHGNLAAGAPEWIEPLAGGLALYGATEGW